MLRSLYYSASNNSKMVQHKASLYLQWRSNRKSYMIYRTAPFSMTLNDPYSRFQGHAIFDAEYLKINGRIYRHSFNGILIGTYTCPCRLCRFEWPWVILSDLAKYSMTRSVARSLYDSWASCLLNSMCRLIWLSDWLNLCRLCRQTIIKQKTPLSQRDRVMLRVTEYFVKSLKVTPGYSKWRHWVRRLFYFIVTMFVSRTVSEIFSVK